MRALFLWLLVLTCCLPAPAQRYPILPVAGSPIGDVFTLMQDRTSRLWAGTIDNVYMFDGERAYSLRPFGFPRETPNAFSDDSEGGIWIGTQGSDAGAGSGKGGLYRYQNGRLEKIFSGDVLAVVDTGAGAIMASFATELTGGPAYGDLYLFRREGKKWLADKLLDRSANHLTVDHQGTVLFPCPAGWCEIQQSAIRQRLQTGGHVTPIQHSGDKMVERVLRDRFGCLWFRAEGYASYQCESDAKPVRLSSTISGMDGSAHLEEAADGSIFMLVSMALGRPGNFRIAVTENGVPTMGAAIVAKDGTIWIGGKQLYRFAYPFHLEFWDSRDGVDNVQYLAQLGHKIFVKAGDQLAALERDQNAWKSTPSLNGVQGSLLATPRGNLIADLKDHVTELSGGERPVAASQLPNPHPLNFELAAAPDGRIWLGEGGVYEVTRHGSHLTLEPDKLPAIPSGKEFWGHSVSDLKFEATTRILWGCYGNGLIFKTDSEWHAIRRSDGLLDQHCTSVAPEADGSVWIGYDSGAVTLIREAASGHPVIRNFDSWLRQPLVDASVRFFNIDQRGWLWRGGNDGIHLATRQAAESGRWMNLNPNDGFVTSTFGHPFLSDADGSVWFGNVAGVGHFLPPADFASGFPAPAVFISGFSVGGSAPQMAGTFQDLPRAVPIRIHVGSLQFDRRNLLQIRYRLLPGPHSWITSDSLTIAIGKPHWGRHTLEVQARLATGPWSSTVSESFTITTPLLLTWPALSAFALAGIACGAGSTRWQRRRTEARQKLNRAFPDLAEWRLTALSPEIAQLDGEPLGGRFEAGRVLARGGFAAVAEGRDLADGGRRCAVKIFRQEVAQREWVERRFQQEVRALSEIHHPNVVRIIGSGILPQGTMYLAMEFIEGLTLREKLGNGKLPPAEVAACLRQMGSALDAIHAAGICHRDLKPENLMLRSSAPPGEELVLIDFSIAIVKDPDETVHGLSRAAGTISYMAPEQAIGYADPATDIYSLAKIVIEMLTGERLSLLLPKASMDLPARSRELMREWGFPPDAESLDLLEAALQFDPARRPKDAGKFAERIAGDLERFD